MAWPDPGRWVALPWSGPVGCSGDPYRRGKVNAGGVGVVGEHSSHRAERSRLLVLGDGGQCGLPDPRVDEVIDRVGEIAAQGQPDGQGVEVDVGVARLAEG